MLPPPPLAQAEAELADGWLEYRDDSGRPYYYSPETGQTQWELPSHIAPPHSPPPLGAEQSSAVSASQGAVGAAQASRDSMARTWSLFQNMPAPSAELS